MSEEFKELTEEIGSASSLQELEAVSSKVKASNISANDKEILLRNLTDRLLVQLSERGKQISEQGKQISENSLKTAGEYWNGIDQLWDFETASFDGCFDQALYHRLHAVDVYSQLHSFLMSHEGIVTIVKNNESLTILSIFEPDEIEAIDSEKREAGNRTENQAHERQHLKTFLGHEAAGGAISRAHALPNDKNCNKWWWPMFRMVTGHSENKFNQDALVKLAAMRTNKLVFAGEHQHIYDTLKYGVVCAIPIYESFKDLAQWQYEKGFQMLIVCDSAKTYRAIGMLDEDHPTHHHIQMASENDVKAGTLLLEEMTKILADSLVLHWEDGKLYDSFEDDDRKKMMSSMRDILTKHNGNNVEVPKYKLKDGEDPKIYKIDYSLLFPSGDEGAKYIPDPLLLLIKAAINLSNFINSKKDEPFSKCKLLPGCPSSYDDDESEYSTDIIDLWERWEAKRSSMASVVGQEIEVEAHLESGVESNANKEGDQGETGNMCDAASVCSDLTA